MTWKRCSRDGRVFQQRSLKCWMPNQAWSYSFCWWWLSWCIQGSHKYCHQCAPEFRPVIPGLQGPSAETEVLLCKPGRCWLLQGLLLCSGVWPTPHCAHFMKQRSGIMLLEAFLLLLFLSLCCQDLYSAKLVVYLIYILHYNFFLFQFVLCPFLCCCEHICKHIHFPFNLTVARGSSLFNQCSVLQFWFVSSRLGVLWGFLFWFVCLFLKFPVIFFFWVISFWSDELKVSEIVSFQVPFIDVPLISAWHPHEPVMRKQLLTSRINFLAAVKWL